VQTLNVSVSVFKTKISEKKMTSFKPLKCADRLQWFPNGFALTILLFDIWAFLFTG
jgi:hypothetical protein